MNKFMLAIILISFLIYNEIEGQEKLSVNSWVEIEKTTPGNRRSYALFYLPKEKAFLCLGGAMGVKNNPYSEMTFSLKNKVWENRFPEGKLDTWGKLTGNVVTPKFGYGKAFIDGEKNIRPKLGFGYIHHMWLYNNYAFDTDRHKIITFWHVAGLLTEYDIEKRTWKTLLSSKEIPSVLKDDSLWGAMCYDPHNKTIIGGHGRWEYNIAEKSWKKLIFNNTFLEPLLIKAKIVEKKIQRLKASVRLRFYVAEDKEESKINLTDVLDKISLEVVSLKSIIKKQSSSTKDHDLIQLNWALKDIESIEGQLQNLNTLMKTPSIKTIGSMDKLHRTIEKVIKSLSWVPPKRANSPLVYDAANKKMVLFGGDRQDRIINDTWIYDVVKKVWQLKRPAIAPAPTFSHSLCYMPDAKKILLVKSKQKECWVYDVSNNTWSALSVSGYPEKYGHGWYPGAAVVGEGGVVLNLNVLKRRKAPTTWITKIDVSKTDEILTKKIGVSPVTEKMRIIYKGGKAQPEYHEKNAGVIDVSKEKEFQANLKENIWVKRVVPGFKKGIIRAWSTAVFDPKREIMFHWAGGHSAHCGNDVLLYSTRTNRYFRGTAPEYSLDWGTGYGANLCPRTTFTYKKGPFLGHQRSYAFDANSGKLITPNYASKFFTYDPVMLDWTGSMDLIFKVKKPSQVGAVAMCAYSKGVVAYLSNMLYLYDSSANKWEKLPLNIKFPGSRTDRQGLAYDSKRNRLLLFSGSLNGDVLSYDLKTKTATRINPGWKKEKPSAMREVIYIKHLDCVMTYKAFKTEDSKNAWAIYGCKTNKWFKVKLEGTKPFGVSTGLVYDPNKKLVWMMDTWSQVYVLKPNFAENLRSNID